MIGRQIGHYLVVEKIGAGGMGVVYLARDTRLDRPVALKFLPPDLAQDQERRRRFFREARAASSLNHPNVAHIYEVSETDDLTYLAMEYIEGATLAAKLSGGGRPEAAGIVDIAVQVADALQEAHSRGIVHRDIKPANVMVTLRGQVKVLDFGLAKILPARPPPTQATTASLTELGVVMGTTQYMSPEQALGKEVDARSDLFSLGVLLYEIATGRLPFEGKSPTETVEKILHAQPEAISRLNYEVPIELERIVRKCLEKDPTRRYQTALELLVDLRNLERDSDHQQHALHPPSAARPFRSRWVRGALAALAAAVVIALAVSFAGRREARTFDSLAVLPFENASSDPEIEYVCEGLAESIIQRLSQLRSLKVRAFGSVLRFKGRQGDLRAVGEELGVQALLTGRVAQRGAEFTVSVELLDAREQRHLWGRRYLQKPSGLLEIQEAISREVSERLAGRLEGDDRKRLQNRSTTNGEAYREYLRGSNQAGRRTAAGLQKGIEHFQAAIALDSGYALAFAGLADSYSLLASYQHQPSHRMREIVKRNIEEALRLDEDLAEARTSLADFLKFFEWDWAGAEKEYRRAIELNPGYVTAHHWYGVFLGAMGRHGEAERELKLALEIDPLAPIVNSALGIVQYWAGEYDRALQQLHRTVNSDPEFFPARRELAKTLLAQGKAAEAATEFVKALKLSPEDTYVQGALGHAYARAGRRDEALKVFEELKRLTGLRYVSAYGIATLLAGLDRKDQAFEWLETAFKEREHVLFWLKVDPMLEDLRPDPRFRDIMKRMGLEP